MIDLSASSGSKILKTSLLFFFCVIASFSFASDPHHGSEGEEEKKANPAETPIDPKAHVQDSHEWHILTTEKGPVAVPLPVILWEDGDLKIFSSSAFHEGEHAHAKIDGKVKHGYVYEGYFTDHHLALVYPVKKEGHEYVVDESRSVTDLSITKNVLFLIFGTVIMVFIFFRVKRGYKKNAGKAPKGIQSFFEPIIIFVRDDIAKDNIGEKRYERYLPFLLTVFFFIWFNNLLGLLPAAANLTGNIAVTMSLALITFIITFFSSRKTYWTHIFNPLGSSMGWGAKLPLYLILVPIEMIGMFTKPFSLMIRLFANITAGHIIMLSVIGLTFMAPDHSTRWAVSPLSTVFALVMNLLELFVALLQAYVFTLLAAMYFGQAVEEGHH